mmetsp:Transcript_7436/g.27127  ORF Transcript_7436/g.27127 Transcript_7436/m.27127 type:complete len:95 (+) Transcript_7436:49-333(+)
MIRYLIGSRYASLDCASSGRIARDAGLVDPCVHVDGVESRPSDDDERVEHDRGSQGVTRRRARVTTEARTRALGRRRLTRVSDDAPRRPLHAWA